MSSHSYSESPGSPESCWQASVDGEAVDRVRAASADALLRDRTAALFSAMGDPTRLRLLEALSVEELCVCDLLQLASISQSGVSHQLRVLRELGLVAFRRDGNRAVYRLADEHVRDLLTLGFEHAREGRDS